jgi:PTS system galactitol-specific IIB component
MPIKKKILVACGSGIATASLVSMKLEELFARNGIKADIVRCRIHEVDYYLKSQGKTDLIVATSQVPGVKDIPVLNAVPIISGVGKEELDKKILQALK